MRIFETHAHLDFDQYDADRDELITRCYKAGVQAMVNVGVDAASSRASVALAERWPHVWAAVGFHPTDAAGYDEGLLRELLRHPRVVALGEIGLDYYREYTPHDEQRRLFARQLDIARELDVPVIVHCREAQADCWDMMTAADVREAVFHCFAGDEAFAEQVLGRGWHVSFTGNITYKNSRLDGVIRAVPAHRFFVETDSPYLSPIPHRGKRNDPGNLPLVIRRIAELKDMTDETVAEQTWRNAAIFFRLKEILDKPNP